MIFSLMHLKIIVIYDERQEFNLILFQIDNLWSPIYLTHLLTRPTLFYLECSHYHKLCRYVYMGLLVHSRFPCSLIFSQLNIIFTISIICMFVYLLNILV